MPISMAYPDASYQTWTYGVVTSINIADPIATAHMDLYASKAAFDAGAAKGPAQDIDISGMPNVLTSGVTTAEVEAYIVGLGNYPNAAQVS